MDVSKSASEIGRQLPCARSNLQDGGLLGETALEVYDNEIRDWRQNKKGGFQPQITEQL